MKYVIMSLLAVSVIIVLAGCENQELIQCQEDSQTLRSELTKTQEKLQHEEKASGEMIAILISEGQKETQKTQELQEQLRTLQNERNSLRIQINQLKRELLQLKNNSKPKTD